MTILGPYELTDISDISVFTSRRLNKIYDINVFTEAVAQQSVVRVEKNTIVNYEELTYLNENPDQYSFSEDFYVRAKDFLADENPKEAKSLCFLYDYFKNSRPVKLYEELQGPYKKTRVPFILEDFNLAILTKQVSLEDLFNLLCMNKYKICSLNIEYPEGIVLYKMVPAKQMIENYVLYMEENVNRIKAMEKTIRKINLELNRPEYINIESKADITRLHKMINDNERHALYEILKVPDTDTERHYYISDTYEIFKKYINIIPGIKKLLNSYQLLLEESKDNFVIYLYGKTKYIPESIKVLKKGFHTDFGYVKLWLKRFFNSTYNMMNYKPIVRPDKTGAHYMAMQEAAKELKKLWFINEAFAFGSVVTGKTKNDSDINIAIEMGFNFKKLTMSERRDINDKIKYTLHKISYKYSSEPYNIRCKTTKYQYIDNIFNIVNISDITSSALDFYRLTGAFENSITLFRRKGFVILSESKNDAELIYSRIKLATL